MIRAFDVAIAGDGPAALAAAALLARAGKRVALLGRTRKTKRRPEETSPGAGQRLLRRLAQTLGQALETKGTAVAWWSVAPGEARVRLQRPTIERTTRGGGRRSWVPESAHAA